MPPIDKHLKTSLEKTGMEYKEIHEWLDKDPEKKAERHDITKIYDMERRSRRSTARKLCRNIYGTFMMM